MLQALDGRGWVNPPMVAVLADVYPIRAASTWLLRLHRLGLIRRRQDARGLVLYAISPRGQLMCRGDPGLGSLPIRVRAPRKGRRPRYEARSQSAKG